MAKVKYFMTFFEIIPSYIYNTSVFRLFSPDLSNAAFYRCRSDLHISPRSAPVLKSIIIQPSGAFSKQSVRNKRDSPLSEKQHIPLINHFINGHYRNTGGIGLE